MEEKETGRIEAFSDGVFSIAITLLVLNISVPGTQEAAVGGLMSALLSRWPNFFALVAQYLQAPDETAAVMIYNGWFLLVALVFNLLWRYVAYHNRLLGQNVDAKLVMSITGQYSVGVPAYLLALLLALVNPLVSIAANFALAIFFAVPSKSIRQLLAWEEEEEGT